MESAGRNSDQRFRESEPRRDGHPTAIALSCGRSPAALDNRLARTREWQLRRMAAVVKLPKAFVLSREITAHDKAIVRLAAGTRCSFCSASAVRAGLSIEADPADRT